jgi:hypothetical protein
MPTKSAVALFNICLEVTNRFMRGQKIPRKIEIGYIVVPRPTHGLNSLGSLFAL